MPTIDLHRDHLPQELNLAVATIVAKCRSLKDLQTRLSAPLMPDYREKVKGLVDKVSIKILEEAYN